MFLKANSMKVILTMNYSNIFHKQSQLILDVLPFVSEEKCFALKGGTAINYFHQNMPRLSVDIDLVFLPLLPREETFAAIHLAIQRIGKQISIHMPGTQTSLDRSQVITFPKLVIRKGSVDIK